uniref:Uncharacterized protein n=1 Tax=Panthera leo TaxID=9689 RepID=A0A8C8WHK3_PANLE
MVVLDEELEGFSPDELNDKLLEWQPHSRCIVINTNMMMEEVRILCLIFSSPDSGKQQMMYAGSKNKLVPTAELPTVFEIRNTEEWLHEKLGFFH